MIKRYGLSYPLTVVLFLGLDAIWLSLSAGRLYRPFIGDLMADEVNLPAAILFYAFYVGGIVFFALAPAFEKNRTRVATLNGAVLGFVAYGTYDLTNQATLKGWPIIITLADMAWGTVLTSFSATVAFLLVSRLANSR